MNDDKLLIQTVLDLTKSKKALESDIKKISTELKPITLDAKLNPSSVKYAAKQLDAISRKDIVLSLNSSNLQKQLQQVTKQLKKELASSNLLSPISVQPPTSTANPSTKSPEHNEVKLAEQWLNTDSILSGAADAVRDLIKNTIELDKQLLELAAMSNLSSDELKSVTQETYNLGNAIGKTSAEVLDSIISLKKSGYDISDSLTLANESLKMTNLSSGLTDAGTAAENLIRILDGFKKDSGFASNINDALSSVSMSQGIDFNSLASGANYLSESAHNSGLSFEQMLGTLAGTYKVLGDIEQTAAGQAAIFAHLQGIQLKGEEITRSTARLQEEFSRATGGTVNVINQQTGELRNSYDILTDLSKVWNNLDKKTQIGLAIDTAGVGQEEVFLAMMNNWNGVKTAAMSASNSFGMANLANQKYLDSLSGKVDVFRSQLDQLSQSLADSDLLKFFVDLGTKGVGALDKLVQGFGAIPMLAGGLLTSKGIG